LGDSEGDACSCAIETRWKMGLLQAYCVVYNVHGYVWLCPIWILSYFGNAVHV